MSSYGVSAAARGGRGGGSRDFKLAGRALGRSRTFLLLPLHGLIPSDPPPPAPWRPGSWVPPGQKGQEEAAGEGDGAAGREQTRKGPCASQSALRPAPVVLLGNCDPCPRTRALLRVGPTDRNPSSHSTFTQPRITPLCPPVNFPAAHQSPATSPFEPGLCRFYFSPLCTSLTHSCSLQSPCSPPSPPRFITQFSWVPKTSAPNIFCFFFLFFSSNIFLSVM